MPIYTFECEHCGYKFERLQHVYDEDRTECPRCEKKADKVPSVPSPFKFSGKHWSS